MNLYFICRTIPAAMPTVRKWSHDELVTKGYRIENGKITDVALTVNAKGYMSLDITIKGDSWGVVFGGYPLGKGYFGPPVTKGTENGFEILSQILQTVGTDDLMKLKGQYVRVADKVGSPVRIIGNIIDDKWFDYSDYTD